MSDSSSAASYIHMVQHMIEECMLFKMSKEECMEALSKHANILPIVTSTVWKELEKENKEFFEDYYTKRAEEKQRNVSSELDMLRKRMEKMVLDFNTK
ncbi:hypothetical protein DCAR_0310469 [Daucus carota subsp. sativus]|uniref:Angiotensin-converting enzyme 2 n=1 Tax=Daucus carota subsp. sativus TaxID=79200 RepID=A0AAF0WKU9_DAUCS|nr:PREDICTED: uncharacterized protein LOC108213728 [Daucus carota subsp. sativus]WOG91221.1 hypothetical protein DCAR_0310469 [Daucus carota subsp. sativus]